MNRGCRPALALHAGRSHSGRREPGECGGREVLVPAGRIAARARRTGTGVVTAVMFVLVPQVTPRKRLDVAGAARRRQALLPHLVLEAGPLPPAERRPARFRP